RIPLLRGRSFGSADVPTSPLVAVINRGLAHRLFGDADPIGRRFGDCVTGTASTPVMHTVVGVIGDVHGYGLQNDVSDEAYYASSQIVLEHGMALVVRGAVPVETLVPAIKRVIAEVDPLLPLSQVTMEEVIRTSLASSRFTTLLLVMLGGMGLVLAVIGIYGVIAYFVVQRRREIGIRMALGATPGRVVRMVVREGVVLAAIGAVVGCAGALAATKVLESMLYEGVSARDPATLLEVSALIGIVAVAASVVPAWRAARVAVVEALRAQ
ncbi:MAG: FtsX-like permease family protein, partial [Gemmatimonadaceae bacterium]